LGLERGVGRRRASPDKYCLETAISRRHTSADTSIKAGEKYMDRPSPRSLYLLGAASSELVAPRSKTHGSRKLLGALATELLSTRI